MKRPSRLRLVVLLLLAPVVSGCIQMPHDGPVVETETQADPNEQLGFYNDPKPPTPGATPTDIVKGFLDAMAATPVQVNTARLYLTPEAASRWSPYDGTVTYSDASLPQGSRVVSVTLDDADHLDSRGAFLGPLPSSRRTLSFPMVRQDGEWRIARAADALVVPDTWYEQNFKQVSLYYFDPTGQILVPEPVFVPRGEKLATSLVAALINGPGRPSADVERTYIPSGLDVEVSVQVTRDGIAQVGLSGAVPELSADDTARMVAQFVWTLGQDSDVATVQVSIGGQPVTLAGGVSTFSLDQGLAYDPTGLQSSSLLYALSGGRLRTGPPDALSQVDGPMGRTDLGVKSIGVSFDATRVAGVTSDGTRLLVTDVRGESAPVRELVSDGHHLLPPVFDFADRIWLVDRPGGRARVLLLRGAQAVPVRIPALTGQRVTQFLVSRDGSRFVAVVHHRTGDRVLVSRLRYTAAGRILGATHAHRISAAIDSDLNVRDIAWGSPTSLVVLSNPATTISEIRTLPTDGAPAPLGSISTTWPDRVLGLVGSPVGGEPLYLRTRTGLVDITLRGPQQISLRRDVTYLTYVGG